MCLRLTDYIKRLMQEIDITKIESGAKEAIYLCWALRRWLARNKQSKLPVKVLQFRLFTNILMIDTNKKIMSY